MVGIIDVNEVEKNTFHKVKIDLATLQGHQAVDTRMMRGKLNAVIIESNKYIDVVIRFKEYPEIELFNVISYKPGTAYLPLKTDSFSSDKELFNYNAEKWLLDDEIEVIIEGNIETEVKFIFRFE